MKKLLCIAHMNKIRMDGGALYYFQISVNVFILIDSGQLADWNDRTVKPVRQFHLLL